MLITYEQYREDLMSFARKLKDYSPSRLFGVYTGGLSVACHLKYYLNTTAYPIYKVAFGSYFSFVPILKGDIIIDDIIDTTQTFIDIRQQYTKSLFASLYAKQPIEDAIIGKVLNTCEYVWLPYQEDIPSVKS
jgi:hypoxanthine phosphoribosyltransferase